jgi:amidase|tara:strand:- start:7399 stop:8856 length:1458 start_codon:yes stop_codon:yes gene_type:complete
MNMTEIWFDSAASLAQKIKAREMSARDALEIFLARTERFNGALNAIIWQDNDAARARADAADAALAAGEYWGPLHGVPVTIKEAYDWVGSPSTWGDTSFANNFPPRNALAVDRLLNAGAVIFGKTNVPRHLADWQTFNSIYGTTNNPWDVTRVPGGSSGGSAAALAAGMTALEFGSDIGASIRNPAHYCGVYGHKPTWGAVRALGALWPGQRAEDDLCVIGPLARAADDLEIALRVMAGPDAQDGVGWTLHLPQAQQRKLSDFKVGVMLTDPNCAQDDALTSQLQHTVDALARAGVKVVDGARPAVDTTEAFRTYLLLLRSATGAHATPEELSAHRARADAAAPDDWSYHTMVDRGVSLSHHEWLKLNEKRYQMMQAWDVWFDDFDFLLCPTAASTAFLHDHEGVRAERTIPINGRREPVVDQLFWAGYSNMALLPSTVAPAGLTRDGLPCGLQIVAKRFHDLSSIHFARLMADVVGGFQPPPGY